MPQTHLPHSKHLVLHPLLSKIHIAVPVYTAHSVAFLILFISVQAYKNSPTTSNRLIPLELRHSHLSALPVTGVLTIHTRHLSTGTIPDKTHNRVLLATTTERCSHYNYNRTLLLVFPLHPSSIAVLLNFLNTAILR